MRLIILLLCFLFFTSGANAEQGFWDKPPHPNGAYGYDIDAPDLLNINGLTYHEARPIIISVGWAPVQTFYKDTEEGETNEPSATSKMFWEKGYKEIKTCTGGGTAYCAFLFQNKNGDTIRIVTKGEEWEELSAFARVVGYRFNP